MPGKDVNWTGIAPKTGLEDVSAVDTGEFLQFELKFSCRLLSLTFVVRNFPEAISGKEACNARARVLSE